MKDRDLKKKIHASILPLDICLFAPDAFTVWTDQPANLTELFGSTHTRLSADLSNARQARILVRIGAVAVVASAIYVIEYSHDQTTWVTLASVTLPATANYTGVGTWTEIAQDALKDVYLRVAAQDGDGAVDPQIGRISLQLRG